MIHWPCRDIFKGKRCYNLAKTIKPRDKTHHDQCPATVCSASCCSMPAQRNPEASSNRRYHPKCRKMVRNRHEGEYKNRRKNRSDTSEALSEALRTTSEPYVPLEEFMSYSPSPVDHRHSNDTGPKPRPYAQNQLPSTSMTTTSAPGQFSAPTTNTTHDTLNSYINSNCGEFNSCSCASSESMQPSPPSGPPPPYSETTATNNEGHTARSRY